MKNLKQRIEQKIERMVNVHFSAKEKSVGFVIAEHSADSYHNGAHALVEQLEKVIQTLKFYADDSCYDRNGCVIDAEMREDQHPEFFPDLGHRAKNALAELEAWIEGE